MSEELIKLGVLSALIFTAFSAADVTHEKKSKKREESKDANPTQTELAALAINTLDFILEQVDSDEPMIELIKKTDKSKRNVPRINGVTKLRPIKNPAIGAPRKLFATNSKPNSLPFDLGNSSFETT